MGCAQSSVTGPTAGVNNTNCENCKNCTDCTNCTGKSTSSRRPPNYFCMLHFSTATSGSSLIRHISHLIHIQSVWSAVCRKALTNEQQMPDCKNCTSCRNCTNERNSTNCSNCSDGRNNTNCSNCSNCQNCTNCTDCSNLKNATNEHGVHNKKEVEKDQEEGQGVAPPPYSEK